MSDPSAASGDWATRTADSIESVVNTVRDRTTRPLLLAGRAVVFGLLAGILGVAAIVLFSILVVRVLTDLTTRAWLAEMILGVLFCVAGVVLLFLRRGAAEGAA